MMKLKVKIKDTGLTIQHITIPAETTVDTLIGKLVQDKLLNPHFIDDLAVKGHAGRALHTISLSELFAAGEKAVLTNQDLHITLTHKSEVPDTLAGQKLLDYQKIIQTTGKFCDITQETEIQCGTVFYIQQQHRQYFIRYEAHGLELFHFKAQYDEAFAGADRKPFLRVELKPRSALTEEELRWVRSIMFPSKESRNPLIHLDAGPISQGLLDDLATLIHRLVVIIGKFQIKGTVPESNAEHIPTYVEMGQQTSVGYITKDQLKNIR